MPRGAVDADDRSTPPVRVLALPGTPELSVTVAILVGTVVVAALVAVVLLRRSDTGTSADRSTYDTLHTASLAAPSLRRGLDAAGAAGAVRHLHHLLGTIGLVVVDTERVLASSGDLHDHAEDILDQTTAASGGRTTVLPTRAVACRTPGCPIRTAVVGPIIDGGTVVGAIVAYARVSSGTLVRAVEEVAGWVSGQIELASADSQRSRLIEAELRALRAQISPHFIYNSLTAIAAFTRSDPGRARDLLLEFADFTRYALRRSADFATLADELRNTERYLVLEQARFGDRLRIDLRVAPEVLSVSVPFLVVQPLVENAVRHGLEDHPRPVTVSISAVDDGTEATVVVEDDGAGAQPEIIRAALEGLGADARSIGLGNVDTRLRQFFGDDYGLVIETAPGAGTAVRLRIPKFAPGAPAAPRG